MKTLNVSISDNEYKLYGIKKDKLTFSDIINIVSKALAKQKLDKSAAIAKQAGLSEMTMDEINEEIKATRKDAKDRH